MILSDKFRKTTHLNQSLIHGPIIWLDITSEELNASDIDEVIIR